MYGSKFCEIARTFLGHRAIFGLMFYNLHIDFLL